MSPWSMVHDGWLMVIMIRNNNNKLKTVLRWHRYGRFSFEMHMTETIYVENKYIFFFTLSSNLWSFSRRIPFTFHIWRNVFLIKPFKLNSVILLWAAPNVSLKIAYGKHLHSTQHTHDNGSNDTLLFNEKTNQIYIYANRVEWCLFYIFLFSYVPPFYPVGFRNKWLSTQSIHSKATIQF